MRCTAIAKSDYFKEGAAKNVYEVVLFYDKMVWRDTLCSTDSFRKVLFISMFLFCPYKYSCEETRITLYTILDKTVEKIIYLDSIFLNYDRSCTGSSLSPFP